MYSPADTSTVAMSQPDKMNPELCQKINSGETKAVRFETVGMMGKGGVGWAGIRYDGSSIVANFRDPRPSYGVTEES